MNARHANAVLGGTIIVGLFITTALMAIAAQPKPTVTATNYFLTTNYVVSVVVTTPCPSSANDLAGPVNLTATAPTPTNILLRWKNQSTNQVNVQIYRRTGGKGRWWLVADVGRGVSNVLLSATPNTACEFYALGLFPEDIASTATSDSPPANAELNDRLIPKR